MPHRVRDEPNVVSIILVTFRNPRVKRLSPSVVLFAATGIYARHNSELCETVCDVNPVFNTSE